MCCGAINRELGVFYNGLGLSTPQILDIRSLPHMRSGWRSTCGISASIWLTICTCTSAVRAGLRTHGF